MIIIENMTNSNKLAPEQIETIIKSALNSGGDFAEVYYEYKLTTTITLQENKIKSINHGIEEGVGVRVLNGDQTGYAYSDSLEITDLIRAAETASLIAVQKGKLIQPVPVNSAKAKQISIKDRSIDRGLNEKVELVLRANDAAGNVSSKIYQSTCGYFEESKFVRVANSNGLFADSDQNLFLMYVNSIAVDNSLREIGTEFYGGRRSFNDLVNHSPERIAVAAAEQAIRKLKSKPAPAGNFPVVINQGWGGVLVHEAVGHGLEGDFNRKGTSIYSGKIGQKVASEKVTIVDDGTIENGRGTLGMDDEGNPAKRNILIENGILKNYMQDSLNSKLMNSELTGNGRRQSYKHIPMPRMTNTFIEKGNDDPESLFKDVKKGVYAKSLGGGQVDIVNGNFVFQVNEGYMIENGKITYPIKGANLVGNGPEAMKKVVGVGNDLHIETATGMCGKEGQSVMVSVGQPTILISEMTVGGTQIQ